MLSAIQNAFFLKKTEHLARFCVIVKDQTEKHDLTHYEVFGSWIQYIPWELVRGGIFSVLKNLIMFTTCHLCYILFVNFFSWNEMLLGMSPLKYMH